MTFSFSSVSYLAKNPADLFSHISSLQTPPVPARPLQPSMNAALQNEFYLQVCASDCAHSFPLTWDRSRRSVHVKHCTLISSWLNLLGSNYCVGTFAWWSEFPHWFTCLLLTSWARRGQRSTTGIRTEGQGRTLLDAQ